MSDLSDALHQLHVGIFSYICAGLIIFFLLSIKDYFERQSDKPDTTSTPSASLKAAHVNRSAGSEFTYPPASPAQSSSTVIKAWPGSTVFSTSSKHSDLFAAQATPREQHDHSCGVTPLRTDWQGIFGGRQRSSPASPTQSSSTILATSLDPASPSTSSNEPEHVNAELLCLEDRERVLGLTPLRADWNHTAGKGPAERSTLLIDSKLGEGSGNDLSFLD